MEIQWVGKPKDIKHDLDALVALKISNFYLHNFIRISILRVKVVLIALMGKVH